MEEQINYTFVPSLVHLALIKTATILWNQDLTRDLIVEAKIPVFAKSHKEWLVIEDKVEEKVRELLLPESLKIKVSDLIKPIGFEILKFKLYHESYLPARRYKILVRESLSKLCWTSQGTVDRNKTVQSLIKYEGLDITERYTLACIYCFENDILTLWNKMPENCKRSYYIDLSPLFSNQDELVLFWTFDMCDDVLREISVGERRDRFGNYQDVFFFAVQHGNKVAAEYFLQKLTPEEREEPLYVAAKYCSMVGSLFKQRIDLLCFLLSQMTEGQRLEVWKEYPFEVLEILLDWPRQDSFMETAKHLWAFLPKNNFYSLLVAITERVKDGYKDYNYQRLFREFWQQSPITHKEYVIYECTERPLIFQLFHVKYIENIKLILEAATITDREKVIFSHRGKLTCESLFDDDKMDLLKFFVRECISSKDVMIKFRKEFEKHIIHQRLVKLRKKEDKWNEFCQFFDDLIQTYD